MSTPASNFHTVTASTDAGTANMIPYQSVPSVFWTRSDRRVFWVTSEFATVNVGDNFIEAEVTESESITLLGRINAAATASVFCEVGTAVGTEAGAVPGPWTRTYFSDTSPSPPSSRLNWESGSARAAINPQHSTGNADWFVAAHPDVPTGATVTLSDGLNDAILTFRYSQGGATTIPATFTALNNEDDDLAAGPR